jgi:outer membrane protein TolC
VAGLVRSAIWDIALQELRLQQAEIDMRAAQQLANDITRRVQAGDLAQTDALLIQTDVLKKRSALTLAEAEVMHARKRYTSLTQSTKIPANYHESLSQVKEIESSHPALQAIQNLIERKQAELEALNLVGSGQTTVAVGVNSDRPSNRDSRSNNTESFNVGVTIPFGGQAHLDPQLAALNVEINQFRAKRDQLFRDLEQNHHEAEHNLEINEAELAVANELNTVAQKHLTLTQLSFKVGEIDLIDLLKIQSQTQLAALAAKERALVQERDYALYNQAVGVLP